MTCRFNRKSCHGLLAVLLLSYLFVAFAPSSLWARRRCRSKVRTYPIVIAHRGACGYLPEHTLVAKAMAHAFNPDYIEQDVVLTKDDVPIVIHDHYLDTVTDVARRFPDRKRKDARYYAIDFTWAEIQTLRVFERINLKTGTSVFPKRFPHDLNLPFRVSSLEQEIRMLQGLNKSTGRKVGIYVELKAPAFHEAEGKDIAKVVLPLLEQLGYSEADDMCYLQCFDPNYLKRMRYVMKTRLKLVQLVADDSWNEAPGVLYSEMLTKQGLAKIARYANGVGFWINQLVTNKGRSTGVVEQAKALGLAVHPYTLRVDALPAWANDDPNKLLDVLFRRLHIDGIFSDFPDVAIRYLLRIGQRRK